MRPRRVLLAEDDPSFRLLVAASLRRDGFEVTEVGDGRELVRRVASHVQAGEDPFDLVVSDIRMPQMTGLDALAGLRRADWATRVILISAFADHEVREEARRLGADAVFSKPFDLSDLRTMAMHFAGP